jgi:hypothetical protein
MRWSSGLCLDREEHLHLRGHDSGILHDLAGSSLHVLQCIHFHRMLQPWVAEAQRIWALQRLGGDWQRQLLGSLRP